MNDQQKADHYGRLLNEHTKIGNQVSEIKGENIEMNDSQLARIKQLQTRQIQIMNTIREMLN
jgi:uncharacterized protein YdcH (DUF465 family)